MSKIKASLFFTVIALGGIFFMSADHIDAPAVKDGTSDLADFYAFESKENVNNMIFAATLQGLLSPSSTASANFDENVLIEINIDNDADNVEDLVIQIIPRDGKMYAFGPYAPSTTGKNSTIDDSLDPVVVDITQYGDGPIISSNGDKKLFAGPRDDPFFFDLGAYSAILGGTATGFSDPGADTFAGTNVLAVVIEVPKSTLGNTDSVNTWIETKRKQ